MTTKRRPSHINLSAANAAANMDSSSLLAPRTPKSISKSRRSSIVQESGISFNNNNNSSNSRPSSRRSSLANIYNPSNSTNNTNNPPHQHSNESDTSINSTATGQLTPSLLSESTTAGYFQQDLRHSSDSMEMEHHPHSNDSAAIAAAAAVAAAADAAADAMAALPPNFDVHMSYKIKTIKSSKKLDYFFGEQAPHDICVQEIRKEGLKAMLQSKIPLCYFLYHLLEEFSCENLVSTIFLYIYVYISHTAKRGNWVRC